MLFIYCYFVSSIMLKALQKLSHPVLIITLIQISVQLTLEEHGGSVRRPPLG